MSEKLAAKAMADIARTTVHAVETIAKKAWSVIDAASEKKSPNEVVSQTGVKRIQGFLQDGK